jgi:hypothetical protein
VVLSICVHCDVVILYGAVKLSVTYNLTVEKIIGNRGVFLFYQKNYCNNGHVDVIVAVIAMSIFKNGLDDVAVAIIAVCIFNNRHYDVIIPVIENRHYNNELTVTIIAVVEPAMTLT